MLRIPARLMHNASDPCDRNHPVDAARDHGFQSQGNHRFVCKVSRLRAGGRGAARGQHAAGPHAGQFPLGRGDPRGLADADRPAERGTLGQRFPDGDLFPADRPGTRTRVVRGRTVQAFARAVADLRRAGRHGGTGADSFRAQCGAAHAGRLRHSDGDRHRLCHRRNGAAGFSRARGPQGVCRGLRGDRRPRCDPRDRGVLQQGPVAAPPGGRARGVCAAGGLQPRAALARLGAVPCRRAGDVGPDAEVRRARYAGRRHARLCDSLQRARRG